MNIKKNDEYKVDIIDITLEGQGVAKIDGVAVFIPNTALNDVVRIKIVKVLKNYAFGIPLEIIIPSEDRVLDDCEVGEKCGGCAFRHISYESELAIKHKAVEDCFNRLGKINMPAQQIVGSEDVDRYRNKTQYPICADEEGKAYAGFYAKRSHRVIECYSCKLQPNIFNEILMQTLKFINEKNIPVYDERAHKGLIRHLYLRSAESSKEIMLCLVCTKKDFEGSVEFSEYIMKLFPEIKTVVINHNPERTNVILGKNCKIISGSGYIEDVMCGVKVRISPLAFYQVNKKQAQKLYEKAMEYADLNAEDVLLDLYCGIGTIGLSAAERVETLIGVEVIKSAVNDADYNAKINEYNNTRFVCLDCTEAVKKLRDEKISPDVIIVDPPRKGCDSDVINAIAEFAPKRVVMVSCNPSTAARDCALLFELGYEVKEYIPFDLFPRTSHVETIVLLSRKDQQSCL